jgi:hypothetical protein
LKAKSLSVLYKCVSSQMVVDGSGRAAGTTVAECGPSGSSRSKHVVGSDGIILYSIVRRRIDVCVLALGYSDHFYASV